MEQFFQDNVLLLGLIMLWTLPWKGYALWTAASMKHKGWFIALLILNTVALLDIIYIFFVAKRGKALSRILSGGGK